MLGTSAISPPSCTPCKDISGRFALVGSALRSLRPCVIDHEIVGCAANGIPDFRSPGGVWSKMKPITFQEFVGSTAKRAEAWDRVFNRTAGWTGASPNAGHRAVAQLVISSAAHKT